MEHMNPTFWFGSANADRSFGLWFIAAIAGLLATYWLICLVWDWMGRPDRLMKRQLDREYQDAKEYKRYRLDRRENRTGEEKRETAR